MLLLLISNLNPHGNQSQFIKYVTNCWNWYLPTALMLWLTNFNDALKLSTFWSIFNNVSSCVRKSTKVAYHCFISALFCCSICSRLCFPNWKCEHKKSVFFGHFQWSASYFHGNVALLLTKNYLVKGALYITPGQKENFAETNTVNFQILLTDHKLKGIFWEWKIPT